MQLPGRKQAITAGGAIVAMALLAACSSSGTTSSGIPAASSSPASGTSNSAAALSGSLNASGSTFQTTAQQLAIQGFKSVQSGITVNYGSGGSGKGRSDLAAGTVQFAGSDSPIPASEMPDFKGKKVLYFPVQIGPIDIAYNLSGVSSLKLDAPTIAGIFQGTITSWDDPAIKALNPGVSLPSIPIVPAVRSDSSGTTQNFSLFLQDATPAWRLGSSSTIKWPSTAHAASGNPGVAQVVKSTDGAIGYVDASTVLASSLKTASIKNKAGQFVAPSSAAATTDAAAVKPAANLTFAAVWASSDPTAYPITYQSWDLVYAQQPNANTVALLKAYLGYLLSSAVQNQLSTIGLAPLPPSLDQAAVAQLSQITAS